jgi:hypothetical protein
VRLIIQIQTVCDQFFEVNLRRALETAVATTTVAFASTPVTTAVTFARTAAGTRSAIAAWPTIATLTIAFPGTTARTTAATLPFRTRTSLLLLAALAHGL